MSTIAKLLAAAAVTAFAASAATAAPLAPAHGPAVEKGAGLVQVHHRHYHRHRGVVVDAPYAYVDTRRSYYYDDYYPSRRGVRVRAPFVNLWVR